MPPTSLTSVPDTVATVTTAAAAWWQVALLAGALTIAGGVLVGVISLVSTALSDNRKAKEATAIRQEKRLEEASAKFLNVIADLYYLHRQRNEGELANQAAVHLARANAYQASSLLQLAASADVSEVARQLFMVAADIAQLAVTKTRDD